ncbi:MAG: SDR family oxidoreductase [bacterium]
MKIFLTGGTGFVGSSLRDELVKQGHQVVCLVREQSQDKLKEVKGIETVVGSVTDSQSLEGKMAGCDAVIHLVGIIREIPAKGVTFSNVHFHGSRNMIDEARRAKVPHFLYMSALGVKEGAKARYLQTKYKAEEYLKKSGLTYTIFRPSFIYGEHDASINMFADMLKGPVFPIIGDGRYKQQPVALEDVRSGFIKSLNNSRAHNQTFEIGGPEQFEFQGMIDVVAEVLRRKPVKIHQPVFMMKPIVKMLGRFSFFPITSDQLLMLLEDNVCDSAPYYKAFDIAPTRFKEGISRYLKNEPKK